MVISSCSDKKTQPKNWNLHRHRRQIEKVSQTIFLMPCDLVAAIAELLVPKCWNQSVPILDKHWQRVQSWNHGFSVLGASGSQTLEPTLPNFGTVCFRFKKLLTPKDSNQCVPNLELYGPIRGTAGLQRLEPIFPSWNHGFQVPGSAGSQQLRFCLVT